MTPEVCIMTCTGDRHEAFLLLQKYVARQTFGGGVQWLVVDDGRRHSELTVPLPPNIRVDHVKLPPVGPGFASFRRNMKHALANIGAPLVVVMEDDEWYGPRWVKEMAGLLEDATLAGERRALYYNVKCRLFRRWNNTRHASMCQTAFRREFAETITRKIQKSATVMIDKVIWKMDVPKKMAPPFNQCVGIKGMPGRGGIGAGHRPRKKLYKHDADGLYLKGILGDADAEPYLALYDPMRAKVR